MKITLTDGREELFQWDTGVTVQIDGIVNQIHFSNKILGRSVDVDAVQGENISTARVPDFLLQAAQPLRVYAYTGTAGDGHTLIEQEFKVNKRNMPADYVFMPPNIITLQDVINMIGNLKDLQTEDKTSIVNAINELVETGGSGGTAYHDFLKHLDLPDQHPITAIIGLVDALASKQPAGEYATSEELTTGLSEKQDKGNYALKEDIPNISGLATKQEVTQGLEAKADKTEIPTELPTPHNLTFTGAATGEFNGSQPLNIEIPEAKEYILPTATPDILGGLMPVAKTPTMGQEVGSDEQGRLFTEQSIKRINPFDLSSWPKEPLIDFVSEEAVTQIGITTLTDGAPILGLNLKECLVEVYIPYDSENANILPATIWFKPFGGSSSIEVQSFIARRNDCQNLFYYSFNETDFIEKVPLLQHVNYANNLMNVHVNKASQIAGFGIKTGGYQLPIGTIIKMWGR